MLQAAFDDDDTLLLYDARYSKTPSDTIFFVANKSEDFIEIRDYRLQRSWVAPEIYKPDYDLLFFRCTQRHGERIEIVTHKSKNIKRWITLRDEFIVYDWPTFLRQTFSIERIKAASNPIHAKPNSASKVIPYRYKDCFQALSIEGEWIEITATPQCTDQYRIPESQQLQTGWIRWRRGDALLISYSMMM